MVTLGADGQRRNGSPVAYATYVDARDGSILLREDLVDHDSDNPEWTVFPNTPPVDYSSTDTRVRWCAAATAGCDEVVGSPASPLSWDRDSVTGPTSTTTGNNSFAVHNWFNNNPFSVGTELATPSPDRDYSYAWTNQWLEQRCNPNTTFTSPQRNDIDAARANLFAMHNREHDWAYHLGFTEALWNMQKDNFGQGWSGQRRRAGKRAGRRGQRWPGIRVRRAGQRQPDHSWRRHRTDHQHVPVAADCRLRSTAGASTATST